MAFLCSEFEDTDCESEYSNTSERSRYSSHGSLVSSDSDTRSSARAANSKTRMKPYSELRFSSHDPCRLRGAFETISTESLARQQHCEWDYISKTGTHLHVQTDDKGEGSYMYAYSPASQTGKSRVAYEDWLQVKTVSSSTNTSRINPYPERSFQEVSFTGRSALEAASAESVATQDSANWDNLSNIVPPLNIPASSDDEDEDSSLCSYSSAAQTLQSSMEYAKWLEAKNAANFNARVKQYSELNFSGQYNLSDRGATETASTESAGAQEPSNWDRVGDIVSPLNIQSDDEGEVSSICSYSSAGQIMETRVGYENWQKANNAYSTISSLEKCSELTLNQVTCSGCNASEITAVESAAIQEPLGWKYLSNIEPSLSSQSTDEWKDASCSWSSTSQLGSSKKQNLKTRIAYEIWLENKKKLLLEKAARKKELEEKKRQEQENRKRLAAERYVQWLEAKARQTPSCQKLPLEEPKPISSPAIDKKESQLKLEQWEMKKRLAEERQRELKRRQEEYRLKCEEQRRQQAAEAWAKWASEAVRKPKPAPFNRGFSSLRGNPPMFVNPKKWEGVLTEAEEED